MNRLRPLFLHWLAPSSLRAWSSGMVGIGRRTMVSWGWGVGISLRSHGWYMVRIRQVAPQWGRRSNIVRREPRLWLSNI